MLVVQTKNTGRIRPGVLGRTDEESQQDNSVVIQYTANNDIVDLAK